MLRRRVIRAAERARLVLASSRTVEEIVALERRLGVAVDFIAENGAQIAVRDPDFASHLEARERLASSDGDGGSASASAPPLYLRHFGARLEELVPGLREAARRHALNDALRDAPGWPGAAPADAAPFRRSSVLLPRALFANGAHAGFLDAVRRAGLETIDGGEWTSISRGSSKGNAVRAYAAAWRAWRGDAATAAIGNSDNDESMMRAVDRAFVIRNPDGHPEALASLPTATLLSRPACAGWHEALALLDR